MEKMFVDLECIVTNAGEITENLIEKTDCKASKVYLMTVDELYRSKAIDHEEYRTILDIHYDAKDRLLEEIDDNYKNVIDYHNIYTMNNANINMVNYVSKMANEMDTYIIFYYNTEREYDAKYSFCERNFKNVKIIGIKYHKLPYSSDIKRKKTNKAQYIKEELGLKSLEGCILIDKSIVSCNDWNKENGETIAYRSIALSLLGNKSNALKILK